MQVIHGNSILSILSSSHYLLLGLLLLTSFIAGALACYASLKYLKLSPIERHKNSQQVIPADAEHGTDKEQNLAFIAYQIKSVIKNLINSQYVLKDKENYPSLFQTPLRQSIHKLRVISESLLAEQALELPSSIENFEQSCSDIPCLIKQQIDATKTIIEQEKVAVTYTNFIEKDVSVNLPHEWLNNAIQEVLFNAIKHNNKRINLKVTSSISENHVNNSAEKYVIVSILDNGQGIPRAITEHFTDNSDVVSTLYRRKTDRENLVNLSLIQEKLIRLGGKLVIKSARHYRTQVDLWIPIQIPEGDLQSASQLQKTDVEICKIASNSATPRLLWVSKQNDQDESIKETLNKNYILQMATSIEQGFSFVPTFKPDCILVDSNTQLANGMITKKWMHESGTFSDIPVVSLGGLLDKSSQLSALQVGVSAVVEKPIVYSELASVISSVINEKVRLTQRVEEIIALYHSNSIENIELENGPANRFFAQFNALLEEHFHDDAFRIAQAADMMHTSDKTLSRKLAKYYNLGFCDLLKKFRLNKAKELIVSGERISNVAYDTGFSSPSYFTQCFRAEFGFAPSMLSKK